jgi:hypothetical protein
MNKENEYNRIEERMKNIPESTKQKVKEHFDALDKKDGEYLLVKVSDIENRIKITGDVVKQLREANNISFEHHILAHDVIKKIYEELLQTSKHIQLDEF